jgi:hypothetical protein
MVQNHNAPEEEGHNRITKFKLASITKAGIQQMKLMKTIKGVQKVAQKTKEAVNKMNLLLLLRAFTKTIGN